MFRAGGLLPFRTKEDGEIEFLLLEENRYNKQVLHVAGGRVETSDPNIRATIKREFIEEVGEWPLDLERRVGNATLSCPTQGYCLATVNVSDVSEAPPENTHWVSATAPANAPLPLSWLATRCVSQRGAVHFSPNLHRVKNA
jgi:hypothetical protein